MIQNDSKRFRTIQNDSKKLKKTDGLLFIIARFDSKQLDFLFCRKELEVSLQYLTDSMNRSQMHDSPSLSSKGIVGISVSDSNVLLSKRTIIWSISV